MLLLDVGCGTEKLDGYIGVDPFVDSADVQAFMWSLPYPDDSADAIYSSHALEHVSKVEVLPTLREWRRVIKPGSIITIRVPDLGWCCEEWLKNPDDGWQMATLFGSQTHPGEFHKTGFTKALMEKYLSQAGLHEVSFGVLFTHNQKTMSFEVRK